MGHPDFGLVAPFLVPHPLHVHSPTLLPLIHSILVARLLNFIRFAREFLSFSLRHFTDLL